MGNIKVGNGKDLLYKVVMYNIPYIGYPRSLNALSAVDTAAKNMGN